MAPSETLPDLAFLLNITNTVCYDFNQYIDLNQYIVMKNIVLPKLIDITGGLWITIFK